MNEIQVAVFNGEPFGLKNLPEFLNRCNILFDQQNFYSLPDDENYIICTDQYLESIFDGDRLQEAILEIVYCHNAFDGLLNGDEIVEGKYLSEEFNLENIVGISRDNDIITAADDKGNIFKLVLSNINGRSFNIIAKSTFNRTTSDIAMFFNNCINNHQDIKIKGTFGDPYEGMFVFAMDKDPRSLDKFTKECLFDILSDISKTAGMDNIDDLKPDSLGTNIHVYQGVKYVTVADSWGNKFNLLRHNF